MKVISFIITNFNTKEYTKFVYNSIRKNLGYIHEIVMLDDGSEDGTWELLQELKKTDHNMKIHRNEENIGIAYSYNKMVELASNEIVCMLHSDMYVPPKFDEVMLKYMEEYDFITPLRVEPDVGYPGSVDKMLIDFGTKSKDFQEYNFNRWHEKNIEENKGRTEQRMFFPWMTTKTFYNKVGGNDELFLKYMVDDDDFYLRIKMAGGKYTQLFETAVYHMPSKSVRMREDDLQVEVDEQYNKSIRNFIRKWGCAPGEVWNSNRDMVIPIKYDIGFVIKNCNEQLLSLLEPWCSNIYIDHSFDARHYIDKEQPNTLINLDKRIQSIYGEKVNDIEVRFDAEEFNQNSFDIIQQLPKIITNDEELEIGSFGLDIFEVNINKIKTYEKKNMRTFNKLSKI